MFSLVRFSIDAAKEEEYPLVIPIKEGKFKKDFFEDVRFRIAVEGGKEVIYGSYKSEKDSLKWGARLAKFLKYNEIEEVWVRAGELRADRIVEGVLLASYEFNKYKVGKEEKEYRVHVIGEDELVNKAKIVTEAVFLARDLTNEPANKLTPQSFANKIQEIFKDLTHVSIDVLDERELESKGLNGVLAVGKGSVNPPRLVIIKYKGDKGGLIAIVGKGVCFDAGGIHLKPTGYIEDMKMDMAGAAAALGAVLLAAKLGLRVNLAAVIPLVENIPGPKAARPGDIIKMFNGKTVEIVNTDAEGRLILADSISFAEKELNASTIIDLATLTGAQIVALGHRIAAIMGNDKELVEKLKKTGEDVQEYLWELPLPDFYEELVKGDVSDLKNLPSLNSREAGSIVGGLFLKNFVEKAKWAHIDLAGPAINPKEWEWMPKGGTGFGVRLLVNYLENISES